MYAFGVTLFCVTVRVTFFSVFNFFYRVNSPFKLFLTQEKFEPSKSVRLGRHLGRRRKSFTSKASAGIRRKDEEEKRKDDRDRKMEEMELSRGTYRVSLPWSRRSVRGLAPA